MSGRDGSAGPAGGLLTRPVVVYDGSCAFCRRWTDRLRRWDRAGRLAFVPLQDPQAPAVTGKTREALRQAAHVALPDGRVVAGARAFRELCRYLPGGWIPRAVLSLPGALPLAERGYAWIARQWGPVGPPPAAR